MKAESLYISGGCRRGSSCADCLPFQGLVAFACGSRLCFWDAANDGRIHAALNGHVALITKVKFLNEETVVTGDDVGQLRLWHLEAKGEWSSKHFAEPLISPSITALGAVHLPSISMSVVASGSSDGNVRIWLLANNHSDLVQEIEYGERIPLDCTLGLLPDSSDLVLAVAGTDSKIRIYTSSLFQVHFEFAVTLNGHTDWVRALAFSVDPRRPSQMMLASGAQDHSIRLWRMSAAQDGPVGAGQHFDFDSLTLSFRIDSRIYFARPEAVLNSHEGWITDLRWRSQTARRLELLSTSTDRSMMLWQEDTATHVWLPKAHFGELKPSEHSLGFFGALHSLSDTGVENVIAHGWSGAFHAWQKRPTGDWMPRAAPTGHLGDVRALAWDPKGEFLLSAGADRTVRMHAPCHGLWRETGRPLTHGHELFDVAFIGQDRFRLACIADEMVVRLYQAPMRCIERLKGLDSATGLDEVSNDRPKSARIPPLGLTSRSDADANALLDDPVAWTQPPLDEELATLTVWAEQDKHYGHGYELRAVASSPDGRRLVTSCKATTEEHAVLRVRDLSLGKEHALDTKEAHSLTVARIDFSSDGQRLLTCSRDRSWRVYRQNIESDHLPFQLLATGSKAHTRMINDACFLCEHGQKFATGSRDKTVKLWKECSGSFEMFASIEYCAPVTALAWHHDVFAVGIDSGRTAITRTSDGQTLLCVDEKYV